MNKQAVWLLLKHLNVKGRKLAEGLRFGEYKSAFRGEGIEFKGVRPYSWGDDIRQMDWNVTARMGTPYVKETSEERELTHIAIIDTSRSMNFGTRQRLKSDLATETVSLLAFLALSNRDRFGLLLYGDTALTYFPPGKGDKHVLAALKLLNTPRPGKSSLENSLFFLRRVLKRRSHLFLLSDFLDPLPEPGLKIISRRHETFPFVMTDPAEWVLPPSGNIFFRDLETRKILLADLGSQKIRNAYRLERACFYENLKQKFLQLNMLSAIFSTAASPLYILVMFLRRLALAR